MHAICDISYTGVGIVSVYEVANLVTELSLRCALYCWTIGCLLWEFQPSMRNLTFLRINLLQGISDGKMAEDNMMITPDSTPNLKVLELHMNCNMGVHIDSSMPLQSVVVVAAGTLHLFEMENGGAPAPLATLKRMYLQSGAPLEPSYREGLEGLDTNVHRAGKRLLQSIKEKPSSWTAAVPLGYQPGDLQECCCGACPECLARVGVPIPWKRAWTKRVRPSSKCGH